MICTSFCTRSADNTRTPHFQNYLTTEWMVFQLNEHTAQCHLLWKNPLFSGLFYNQQKIETLISFIV